MIIQIVNPDDTRLSSDFKDLIVEVTFEKPNEWWFRHKGFEWYCYKKCAIIIDTKVQSHMPRWF